MAVQIDIYPQDREWRLQAEQELQAELERERAQRAGMGGVGLFGTSLCQRLRDAGILPQTWNCAYTLIGAGLLLLVAFNKGRGR